MNLFTFPLSVKNSTHFLTRINNYTTIFPTNIVFQEIAITVHESDRHVHILSSEIFRTLKRFFFRAPPTQVYQSLPHPLRFAVKRTRVLIEQMDRIAWSWMGTCTLADWDLRFLKSPFRPVCGQLSCNKDSLGVSWTSSWIMKRWTLQLTRGNRTQVGRDIYTCINLIFRASTFIQKLQIWT